MATAFGVFFEGLFLVAWALYVRFDANEEQAYTLMTRIELKKEL